MTGAEIEEVLDGFAQTARICVEAGLDGVELHGTHGYLLQQSFSPWGNRRDDEWGEQLAFAPGADRARAARRSAAIRSSACASRPTTSCRPERGGLGVEALRDDRLRARRHGRAGLREPVGGRAHRALRALDRQLPPPARRVPAARPRPPRGDRRPRADRRREPDQRSRHRRAGARSRRLRHRRHDARA